MTATGYTVGALTTFLRDTTDVPGVTHRTIAQTRNAVGHIVRELGLTPADSWDSDTIEQWCDRFATSGAADRMTSKSIVTYQQRLRTAARWFHLAHAQPAGAEAPPGQQPRPRDANHDDLGPAGRDVRLLATAWATTTSDVITRLVDFYRTHQPGSPPATTGDIDVHAFYDYRHVTGVFHRHHLTLTVTSWPLDGQRFRSAHAAAVAVVRALRPSVADPNRNGWDFWTISGSGKKLRTIRPGRHPAPPPR
jgi:hypothetical protein